jgi:hypothetical protein
VDDVFAVLTGDFEPAAVVGAGGDEDGVEVVGDPVGRHVSADGAVGLERHTERTDRVEILLEHGRREPVVRDPHREHAPQNGQRFVHRGLEQGELMGRRQPRRSGADDRDRLATGRDVLGKLGLGMLGDGEALESTDAHGGVYGASIAFDLTGVETHASADPRQRILASDDVGCFLESPGSDQGDVGLYAGVDGAGGAAGGALLLADEEGIGRRLGVESIDGLSPGHACVEAAAQLDRADGGAVATSGTLVDVHVPLALPDGGLEAAGLAFELHDIGHGVGIDVVVAHAFHELG